MISIRHISYSVGQAEIIRDLSTEISAGMFTMILGPNGSGKSTFLKLFSGAITPDAGEICYMNEKLSALKHEEIAKRRAVLSQNNELSFPLTADEVIMMGRYPHFNFSPSAEDENIVKEVSALLRLEKFSKRNYLTLSGGEKQRVQFARCLAQIWNSPGNGTTYLFMDEPLAGLDINYQQEFLKLAKSLIHENLVMVAVMHDINLAAQYGDRLIFLREGKLIAEGTAGEILTSELVSGVFDVSARFIPHPATGLPLMIYES